MISQYIDSIAGIIFSPRGLVGVFVLIMCLYFLFRRPVTAWYFLALMALFASFSEYRDRFIEGSPPLAFPLQQIRQYGRPVTIVILFLLFIYVVLKTYPLRLRDYLNIRTSLLIIQLLIFAKNVLYGNPLTGLLIFLVFFLVYLIANRGTPGWLGKVGNFETSVLAFVVAIIIFDICALYQSRIDFSAMTFPKGQFLGMTGNAQHAAVLLASGIPLFIFLIVASTERWKKLVFIGAFLWSFYYLIQTGSRTGMLMAIVSLMIFVVGYKMSALKWLVLAGLVLLFVNYLGMDLLTGVDENAIGRYSSTENSREIIYRIQIRLFTSNPIFGVNPTGERVGFGENSYLAVAASLGIIGLIPLTVMLYGFFQMIRRLWRWGQLYKPIRHYFLMVIAGIIPLLLGALAEAYLLGNITWALILLLCYVNWGYFLLKLNTGYSKTT